MAHPAKRSGFAELVPGSDVVRCERGCGAGTQTRLESRFGPVPGCGGGHRRRGRAEAGYTMVMFVIIIAVMAISMGVAVQTAEFQMRREREAELIFRGQQFIEAIRLYKLKYGRYPMQLKEIYEAKPRVIRKRWKDPITDSENWGIIFLGQDGRQLGQRGRQLAGPGMLGAGSDSAGRPVGTHTPYGDQAENQPGARGADSSDNTPGKEPGQGVGRGGFGDVSADRKMGPIIGVHSTSCDEAIKIFEGHTTYCEWRFIYREAPQQDARRTGRVPGQPPVGWHPGDELTTDEDGNPVKAPPDGGQPPDPVPAVPRP